MISVCAGQTPTYPRLNVVFFIHETSYYYKGNITVECIDGMALSDGKDTQYSICEHDSNDDYSFSNLEICNRN